MKPIDLNILYIEDDDINLLVIEKMLKQHDVITCKTAVDGKELILSTEFDLILLDMNLGTSKNEGAELLIEIRKAGFNNPIVAISGYVSEDEVSQYLDQGFDAYFTKPIDRAKLVAYIESIT